MDQAQTLVDELYERAVKAEKEASRFRGTSSPSGFGPCRAAEAWLQALELAVKTLGVGPSKSASEILARYPERTV